MLIDVLCVMLLCPATAVGLFYLVLTLVARQPVQIAKTTPRHTLAVLIPAKNEQDTLPATLRSVFEAEYPPDMVRVYVVADNCTDDTAAVATAAGVICLVRTDPTHRGKGFALAFGLEAVQADAPDAVLILDADCVLDREALLAVDATLAAGADAAQLDVRSSNADDGPGGYVAAVGGTLDAALIGGLARFGWSVPLRGTGMAFRLDVLRRIPWTAFSSTEDAEYEHRLRAAGIRIRLAPGQLACSAPSLTRDLYKQRRRWRGALLSGGWRRLPTRLFWSKPLTLVYLFLTAVLVLVWGGPVCVGWVLALVGLTAGLYLRAMLAVGLSWQRLGLLLQTPLVVARLACLAAFGLVQRRSAGWDENHAGNPQPKPSADPNPHGHANQFPQRPNRLMRLLHKLIAVRKNARRDRVTLTFDDGPHPIHTPAVLDRLGRYGVTATFYLVGERAAAASHLVKRIATDGHALGNHTQTHPRFGALTMAEPLLELTQCQEAVPGATSFRPPFGRITPGVILAAWRLGLPVVLWSIDSGDWRCRSEAEAVECANQVLDLVRPGDVILLHDDRPWIGAILDVLLPGLVARGLVDEPKGFNAKQANEADRAQRRPLRVPS